MVQHPVLRSSWSVYGVTMKVFLNLVSVQVVPGVIHEERSLVGLGPLEGDLQQNHGHGL